MTDKTAWEGHTPLPWAVSDSEAHGLLVTGNSNGFCADWLARVNVLEPTEGSNRANAHYIVHCVNNFPALEAERDALREAAQRAQRIIADNLYRQREKVEDARLILRQALAISEKSE